MDIDIHGDRTRDLPVTSVIERTIRLKHHKWDHFYVCLVSCEHVSARASFYTICRNFRGIDLNVGMWVAQIAFACQISQHPNFAQRTTDKHSWNVCAFLNFSCYLKYDDSNKYKQKCLVTHTGSRTKYNYAVSILLSFEFSISHREYMINGAIVQYWLQSNSSETSEDTVRSGQWGSKMYENQHKYAGRLPEILLNPGVIQKSKLVSKPVHIDLYTLNHLKTKAYAKVNTNIIFVNY